VEPFLLHRGFSLSGFHVNLCVSSGLISEIHPLIHTIGAWIIFLEITHCRCRSLNYWRGDHSWGGTRSINIVAS